MRPAEGQGQGANGSISIDHLRGVRTEERRRRRRGKAGRMVLTKADGREGEACADEDFLTGGVGPALLDVADEPGRCAPGGGIVRIE